MTSDQEAVAGKRRGESGTDTTSAPSVGARRHLLSVSDLGAEGIEEVLRVADAFVEVSKRDIPKVPALRGRRW